MVLIERVYGMLSNKYYSFFVSCGSPQTSDWRQMTLNKNGNYPHPEIDYNVENDESNEIQSEESNSVATDIDAEIAKMFDHGSNHSG